MSDHAELIERLRKMRATWAPRGHVGDLVEDAIAAFSSPPAAALTALDAWVAEKPGRGYQINHAHGGQVFLFLDGDAIAQGAYRGDSLLAILPPDVRRFLDETSEGRRAVSPKRIQAVQAAIVKARLKTEKDGQYDSVTSTLFFASDLIRDLVSPALIVPQDTGTSPHAAILNATEEAAAGGDFQALADEGRASVNRAMQHAASVEEVFTESLALVERYGSAEAACMDNRFSHECKAERTAAIDALTANLRSLAEQAAAGDGVRLALADVEALRTNCHATYNGGWHGNDDALRAFHHGMDTVCNELAKRCGTLREEKADG